MSGRICRPPEFVGDKGGADTPPVGGTPRVDASQISGPPRETAPLAHSPAGLLIQLAENSAPELPRPERLLAGEELQAPGLHLQRPTARDFIARQVHRERAPEVGGR